jgi:cell division protease FtsH
VQNERLFLGGRVEIDASEQTRREIDLAVKRIVSTAAERAASILRARRHDLERGVELLLTRETLSPEDFAPLKKADGKPQAA